MEEIIVVAIVFGSILAMVKLILDHVASRRTPSDRSLTASELDQLIEDAVDRSTRELRRRIENLEAIAVDESPPPGRLLLDEPEGADEISAPSREPARKARS